MQKIQFSDVQSILCLGAHADDIEIGCGGTILKLLADHPSVAVHWAVLSAPGERADEAAMGARLILGDARKKSVVIGDYEDSFFPRDWDRIKQTLVDLRRDLSPDLVFTHRLEDRHQDHRVVSELTWCTFRDHLILEYEIPKYEGDLGHPNLFVPLDEDLCRRKIAALLQAFRSQHDKGWFTEDAFWALLRLRGLECNSHSRFAESFYCRKAVM